MHKSEDTGDYRLNRRRVFRPDAYADRLSRVSLDDLATRGINGLIVDLDNTVVGYGRDDLAPEDVAWLANARARGFGIVLLSNNFTGRVARISAELGVPAISSALKPLPLAFARALRVLGTSRRKTAVVGDQLFTDVLGAKLLGLHAILTQPLVPKDWLGTRILRFLERLVIGKRTPR